MVNENNKSLKKEKLSYKVEFSLLGLLLAIISLIGLVNYGYIGGGISFALAYLFGYWYPVFLVAFTIIGLFIFIKRKKPESITPLSTLSFILLIIFLAIASSKYEGASLDNYSLYFKSAFDKCHDGLNVDFIGLRQAKGGFIGFSLYALSVELMGDFMTSVVLVIFVLVFAFLAFKRPIMYTYNKVTIYFETSDDRKVIKEARKKVKEEKKKEKLIEKTNKTNKDKSKLEKLTNKENLNITSKPKICDHPFTFDIFRENLFDEEVKEVVSNPNKEVIDQGFYKHSETPIKDIKEYQQEIIETQIAQTSNKEDINELEPSLTDNADIGNSETKQDLQDDIFASEIDNEKLEEEIEKSEDFYNSNFEYEPIKDDLNNKDDPLTKAIDESIDNEDIFTDNSNKEVEVIEVKDTLLEETKQVEKIAPINQVSNLYDLLKDNTDNNSSDELKNEVEENCNKINQKLEELNIKAKVSDYIIGPCVTRYEIVPELGVRVSSIVNIQNDLKLALAAINLRMEAPIPGKSAVGIEVANKKRYPVYLKEVLEPFKDNNDKLLVAIGKNLNNEPVTLSIDKMPHLLIAGATGSGKSVCINGIIMSLILRSTPQEVKLILVDPKKVEMLPYADMPHLLCPVVTDPRKANNALKKVVVEMDHRYDLFASNGVRNIDSYNSIEGINKLSKIVVIIDELADLMLACSKEVEESIQRITQLARAAGIYLIVATQRPSVDVITGVIKANIPSRIAFSVSSMVDSRTILDKAGAEDLLGKGDMLMDISGTNSLNRVQGVFVSDKEITSVVNAIKDKYDVNFDQEFLNLEDDKKEIINSLDESSDDIKEDPMYEEVKKFVIDNQKASTSILQRYFSLGYIRASKLIDRLEQEQVIGPLDGSKPREVLIKREDLDSSDKDSEQE